MKFLSKLSTVALLLAVALSSIVSNAEARPKRLSSDEVTALLRGNTVYGFNPNDETSYVMFHAVNGRVRAELSGIGSTVSKSDGRWWVNDLGQLCVEWENFRWISSCATVNENEGVITFTDDNGRIISFGEIEVGNPDGI
ncbi:MAG: DUF995 domain-containing protein [Alphaproteobacteria bacterium]|jgi:hypothetical protein|nr:DUF995 domain-containing protein [Alphaproteobacteria bacterium]MDP6237811.1 DUF995 domain-containing protein [Alphaproteobacteria bacterium]MDP7173486.1 DUF995 domain-containing protein [Alphaproteobacteria bacterium]MDP7233451.1 DUF995 domain-containing protein [Alphaproteobacteria bacterium]MDP7486965.1 DUF995 domain-containing protein [Alphaproteobacteria bacterium]|tara:strand:- start:504 stop:923 length:420 start_codon:yes stop_codon:yes gene_type:complete